MKPEFQETLRKHTPKLSSTLVLAYFLGLIGNFYYFFDLFSHFLLQYFVGGILLAPALLYLKRPIYASLVLIIAIASLIEARLYLQDPMQFFAPKGKETYTIVSFNHNYGQSVFQHIENWIRENKETHDVVILLEASPATVEMAERLGTEYPYQIHEPSTRGAFGMVILSRYEFLETEKIAQKGPSFDNLISRITIKAPDAKDPLTLYAMHPPPPVRPSATEQRNTELIKIAERVAAENAKNIVVLGDLNITPFSFTFKDFLEISDLKFQSYGLLLNPSWPTYFMLPIFKIPIDHAFYSDTLIQQRKEIGPAFMSDHNSLIVGYTER